MIRISGVIIAFNEEKNISRCIDSMREVCDEVVVVDSFSTDRTAEIALAKGVRVIEHRFRTHIDQKNFALSQAAYDHVLSLDADEYLSEELIQSIRAVKTSWKADAYRMNRLSSYGSKWIKHGAWYPDRKIRLWNRKIGVWGGENPHDRVILHRGVKVQQLRGDILHRAYRDAGESLQKIQRYSDIFAAEGLDEKSSSVPIIFLHTSFAFVKSYFVKRGFLDGFEGLMVAMGEANHVFYKYAKLLEANSRFALGDRIVVSRTDNLGDVILTLPLLGFLKAVRPGIRITFVGKKYTKAILDHCAHVDRFLDREEVLASPGLLQQERADTILFVFPDRQLARLARQLNIPHRVGTGHRWFNWIYCNYRVGFSRVRSREHESNLNFKLLSPFKLYWDFDLREMAHLYGLKANSAPATLPDRDRIRVILHPKSKGSAREWDLMNYLALARLLPADTFHVYITGLASEGEVVRKECPQLLELPHVEDMTGKFDLRELIAFVNQADVLVACSTGILHLAAALGKACVGIYAPMKPIHPGRWKPIGDQATYLVLDKNCSACKNLKVCRCINEITPAQVLEKIQNAVRKTAPVRYAES